MTVCLRHRSVIDSLNFKAALAIIGSLLEMGSNARAADYVGGRGGFSVVAMLGPEEWSSLVATDSRAAGSARP